MQCPHCGEYYSVTYKYCPFCDAGRQEEERKLAEKKKKKQAFLETSSAAMNRKKEEKSRPRTPIRWNWTARTQSVHCGRKALGRPGSREPAMPREQIEKAHAPKDSGQKEHVGKEPMRKKEPVRRHGARKKTSEMTEEEKAAHLAEREARAAARKRERDRLAERPPWRRRRRWRHRKRPPKRRRRWRSPRWRQAPSLRRSLSLRPLALPSPSGGDRSGRLCPGAGFCGGTGGEDRAHAWREPGDSGLCPWGRGGPGACGRECQDPVGHSEGPGDLVPGR